MKRTLKEVRDLIAEKKETFAGLKTKLEADGFDKLSEDEKRLMEDYPSDLENLIKEERALMSVQFDKADSASRMANVNPGTGNIDISDKEVRDFAKVKIGAALAQLARDGKLSGLEQEVDSYARQDAQKRGFGSDLGAGFAMPTEVGKYEKRGQTVSGQTSASGDQGGVYVPTEINEFIKALWDESLLGQVGARRFSGLVGNQSFPVQSSKPAAQELTEIESMAADEILWSQITMSPERRGTYIPISRRLLIQGSIDTQAFVTDQLRAALAYKLDIDARTELMSITPISLGNNGAVLDWDKVVALETAVNVANANMGSVKYLTNASVVGKLKTTKKDAGSGIFLLDGTSGLNGYDVARTNIIPSNLTKGSASGVCSAMVFGNFQDLYVGLWDGLVFDVERQPKTDQVEVYVNAYWDVKVARNASFATYKDILTA